MQYLATGACYDYFHAILSGELTEAYPQVWYANLGCKMSNKNNRFEWESDAKIMPSSNIHWVK